MRKNVIRSVAAVSAAALSAPLFGGIASANPQPGLASPPSGGGQPGLTSPDPAPAPQRQVWVEVPQQQRYQNVQWRQYDAPEQYSAPAQSAPAAVQEVTPSAPAPPTAVIAPIAAPEGRLRIGDFITDKPEWMSEDDLEKTNNQSALIEADIANAWVDAGLGDADRADKVAAATMAGGATGALLAGGVGAVAGGAAGAAIGTPIGAAGGSVFVPGVGTVAGGTAGAVTGGAVGATAVGLPAAIAGGAAGAFAGAAFGAGDTLPDEEARELFPEPEPLVMPGAENIPGLEAFVLPPAEVPVFSDVLPEPRFVVDAPGEAASDPVQEMVNAFLQG
ncbi:hypothetical protein [Hoyosella altamirensis]|uniref:Insoluble domain protein n=1 Tax=Hoyosella altamirensis TaxID=616997 RepID=A0A839RU46_9ACTN|nr:hypothetical protein [Hoyosella altamirensis]MBB3040080.1 hypothetical protein [Hoyosella altamirensis]